MTNKIQKQGENFLDSAFELADETQPDNSLSDYKHQIEYYSDEIEKMKEKIKNLSKVN